MRIDRVEARQILDTRGKPTIETTISANAVSATASVPSGKSTGSYEAHELRDTDGSVASAVAYIHNEISPTLVGNRFSPEEIDARLVELDGTPNKSRLGANTLLSVSIAAARLSAFLEDAPLWKTLAARAETKPSAPRLYVNVLNGGVHADFRLPFQEYMLVIEGHTSTSFAIAEDAFKKLGEMLGAQTPMGDEGGYSPTFDSLERPFEILMSLVEQFPHTSIAIDAAASEFFSDGTYSLLGKQYSPEELLSIYESLVAKFPIHSIEDPFDEEAGADFSRITDLLGSRILIIGDDLTVTNPARIALARTHKEINAVLIKPNQIGTVSEALRAVKDTYQADWQAIASHRSGETDDTFIADFAFAIGAHGIKAGGLGQKERLEKYERLLEIEREA